MCKLQIQTFVTSISFLNAQHSNFLNLPTGRRLFYEAVKEFTYLFIRGKKQVYNTGSQPFSYCLFQYAIAASSFKIWPLAGLQLNCFPVR